jgi:four helix bundle protein
MDYIFDHEKLRVYQVALQFVAWASELIEEIAKKHDVLNHLDKASTSAALNIAEGNGRYSNMDRCRFFDIAQGSMLESAGCLDVIVAKKLSSPERIQDGKMMLKDTISMIIGLIKSKSDRVYEPQGEYESKEE